jgi:hypothetical protein
MMEWEPPGGPGSHGTGTTTLGNAEARFGSEEVVTYLQSQRYIHINGEVRQFDRHDEKVTVPNLTIKTGPAKNSLVVLGKPVTKTTPSGLSVTLPAQNSRPVSLRTTGACMGASLLA